MMFMRTITGIVMLGGVAVGLISGLAGQWDLWNVWAYGAIFIGSFSFQTLALYYKNPDLLEEREKPAAHGRARWSGYPAFILLGLHWCIAGLDQRFHWSAKLPPTLMIVGLVAFTIGLGMLTWSMLVNRFFSSAVRIQTDRGQHVITTGPYGVVRHPGYAGAILAVLASGVALNSLFSIIPMLFLVLPMTIYRTRIEDQMLHNELAGYTNYAAEVRYRLIPGLW